MGICTFVWEEEEEDVEVEEGEEVGDIWVFQCLLTRSGIRVFRI